MEILCKWNGYFRSNQMKRKKWNTSKCHPLAGAEKSSVDPRMPFVFEPVKRKFFANWKAPQVGYTFSVKSGRLRT